MSDGFQSSQTQISVVLVTSCPQTLDIYTHFGHFVPGISMKWPKWVRNHYMTQHFLQYCLRARWRHRSAYRPTQFDSSLHRALYGQSKIQSVCVKTLISLRIICVFAWRTCLEEMCPGSHNIQASYHIYLYIDQSVHSASMARFLVHPFLDSPEVVEGICNQRKLTRLRGCAGWSETSHKSSKAEI